MADNPNDRFARSRERVDAVFAKVPGLRDRIIAKAAAGKLRGLEGLEGDGRVLERVLGAAPERAGAAVEAEAAGAGTMPDDLMMRAEAIVELENRPTMLVRNGTYVEDGDDEILAELREKGDRKAIETAISRVGRIEFVHHRMKWGGTGWVLPGGLIVTNRHVAEFVAEPDNRGGYRFRLTAAGTRFGARIDFREEFGSEAADEHDLVEVRYLASLREPDIAIFKAKSAAKLPPPLPLDDKPVKIDQFVGVIGYPANDSRNDPGAIEKYFGEIFDVKRFSVGHVDQTADTSAVFMHDATTLGGNSGSAVIDLATGKAVGLHFAGRYREGNYAVTIATLKRALGRRPAFGRGFIPEFPTEAPVPDGRRPRKHFKDRKGYLANFLGRGGGVPFPDCARHGDDIAQATNHLGKTLAVVPYQHFSLALSASRLMPIVTACNIDGAKLVHIVRGEREEKWFLDERYPDEVQLSEHDYAHRDIDRGHMVRRQDPNWGTRATARKANDDTFHYTNAALQHRSLNRPKDQWGGLEDHVLESAKARGLKISVFTGPVLRTSDRELVRPPKVKPENWKGGRAPVEFFKIVAWVDDDTGDLRALAYAMRQDTLLRGLTEANVFDDDEWNGYQVAVAEIGESARIDFGPLAEADVMNDLRGPAEAAGFAPAIAITSLEDLYLGARPAAKRPMAKASKPKAPARTARK